MQSSGKSRELVQACLDNAAKYDDQLNSIAIPLTNSGYGEYLCGLLKTTSQERALMKRNLTE